MYAVCTNRVQSNLFPRELQVQDCGRIQQVDYKYLLSGLEKPSDKGWGKGRIVCINQQSDGLAGARWLYFAEDRRRYTLMKNLKEDEGAV